MTTDSTNDATVRAHFAASGIDANPRTAERFTDRVVSIAKTLRRNAEPEFSKKRNTDTRRRMQIARGILDQAESDIDKADFYYFLATMPVESITAGVAPTVDGLGKAWSTYQSLKHDRTKSDENNKAHRLFLQHRPTGTKSKAAEILKLKAEAVGSGVDFFPTKKELADHMVAVAGFGDHDEILEPSCGSGNLIYAVQKARPKASVYGLEISERLANLGRLLHPKAIIETCDFTEKYFEFEFDGAIMNPPFSADRAHIRKAYDSIRTGGKLVAVCGAGSLMRSKSANTVFIDWLESIGATIEPIDANSFEGTSASAFLIIATKG